MLTRLPRLLALHHLVPMVKFDAVKQKCWLEMSVCNRAKCTSQIEDGDTLVSRESIELWSSAFFDLWVHHRACQALGCDPNDAASHTSVTDPPKSADIFEFLLCGSLPRIFASPLPFSSPHGASVAFYP